MIKLKFNTHPFIDRMMRSHVTYSTGSLTENEQPGKFAIGLPVGWELATFYDDAFHLSQLRKVSMPQDVTSLASDAKQKASMFARHQIAMRLLGPHSVFRGGPCMVNSRVEDTKASEFEGPLNKNSTSSATLYSNAIFARAANTQAYYVFGDNGQNEDSSDWDVKATGNTDKRLSGAYILKSPLAHKLHLGDPTDLKFTLKVATGDYVGQSASSADVPFIFGYNSSTSYEGMNQAGWGPKQYSCSGFLGIQPTLDGTLSGKSVNFRCPWNTDQPSPNGNHRRWKCAVGDKPWMDNKANKTHTNEITVSGSGSDFEEHWEAIYNTPKGTGRGRNNDSVALGVAQSCYTGGGLTTVKPYGKSLRQSPAIQSSTGLYVLAQELGIALAANMFFNLFFDGNGNQAVHGTFESVDWAKPLSFQYNVQAGYMRMAKKLNNRFGAISASLKVTSASDTATQVSVSNIVHIPFWNVYTAPGQNAHPGTAYDTGAEYHRYTGVIWGEGGDGSCAAGNEGTSFNKGGLGYPGAVVNVPDSTVLQYVMSKVFFGENFQPIYSDKLGPVPTQMFQGWLLGCLTPWIAWFSSDANGSHYCNYNHWHNDNNSSLLAFVALIPQVELNEGGFDV